MTEYGNRPQRPSVYENFVIRLVASARTCARRGIARSRSGRVNGCAFAVGPGEWTK